MESRYLQGFNAGYRMEEHAPNILAKMLMAMQKNTPYRQGLVDGGKQQKKEKILGRIDHKRDNQRNR